MVENIESTVNREVAELLVTKIQLIKDSLSGNPAVGFDLSTELRHVHQQLRDDPNAVDILTDEQIGVLVKGWSRETNIIINAPKIKVAKTVDKLLSVDDF